MIANIAAHRASSHCAIFTKDQIRILSAADDSSVHLADLATGKTLLRYERAHTDFIRTCDISPHLSAEIFATGSYDGTVKLWDSRSGTDNPTPVVNLNHGKPVECVKFFPGGSLICTVGGDTVKIWDILGDTSKPLSVLAPHLRTITSAVIDPSQRHLITASLDNHLKVISLADYTLLADIKSTAPVLSLGVSPDLKTLVTVNADHTVHIKRHKKAEAVETSTSDKHLYTDSEWIQNVAKGQSITADSEGPRVGSKAWFNRTASIDNSLADIVVTNSQNRNSLKAFEKDLAKFRYKEALKTVMKGGDVLLIASFFTEIDRRDSLKYLFAGLESTLLESILTWLKKAVSNPRISHIAARVAFEVLDLTSWYLGSEDNVDVDVKAADLLRELQKELEHQELQMEILGLLDIVTLDSSK